MCVSHVSLVPSRNHHTSPFNAVPLGEQCFMIVVCSTYPQVLSAQLSYSSVSTGTGAISEEKEAIKLKTTLKQNKKNFYLCACTSLKTTFKISFTFMLHMNVLHTCMYVYAPCVNLIECLDLGLQIVVSHNVDVEMFLALWKSQQLLFSSLENNF